MLEENKTCVKQSITKHMSLSNSQRKAHVDLNAPCIPVVNKHNTSVNKAGEYATSRHGRRIALKTLTEYHNLKSFNGTVEKVHTCHLCSNDSQAPNGFVCKNPLHLYFGTVYENHMDKPAEIRKKFVSADAKEAGKKGGRIGGRIGVKQAISNGNHMNQQKRSCIHCGYEGNPGSVAQWHNQNCKHNPLSARFKQRK